VKEFLVSTSDLWMVLLIETSNSSMISERDVEQEFLGYSGIKDPNHF
jgi:hypothetical protein